MLVLLLSTIQQLLRLYKYKEYYKIISLVLLYSTRTLIFIILLASHHDSTTTYLLLITNNSNNKNSNIKTKNIKKQEVALNFKTKIFTQELGGVIVTIPITSNVVVLQQYSEHKSKKEEGRESQYIFQYQYLLGASPSHRYRKKKNYLKFCSIVIIFSCNFQLQFLVVCSIALFYVRSSTSTGLAMIVLVVLVASSRSSSTRIVHKQLL